MTPTPPVTVTVQLAAERAYGRSTSAIPSGPCAARSRHSESRASPSHGIETSQWGSGGKPRSSAARTSSTPCTARSSSTATAIPNGTTNTAEITRVISTTANAREPPIHFCTCLSSGHVATTIVVAQINALKKGDSVQRLAAISPERIKMNRKVRVRS